MLGRVLDRGHRYNGIQIDGDLRLVKLSSLMIPSPLSSRPATKTLTAKATYRLYSNIKSLFLHICISTIRHLAAILLPHGATSSFPSCGPQFTLTLNPRPRHFFSPWLPIEIGRTGCSFRRGLLLGVTAAMLSVTGYIFLSYFDGGDDVLKSPEDLVPPVTITPISAYPRYAPWPKYAHSNLNNSAFISIVPTLSLRRWQKDLRRWSGYLHGPSDFSLSPYYLYPETLL